MRELPQSFWDRLDETPTRRAGGFIVGFGSAEFRFRPTPQFPRLKRCRKRLAELSEMDRRYEWLEITGRLLEMEEGL